MTDEGVSNSALRKSPPPKPHGLRRKDSGFSRENQSDVNRRGGKRYRKTISKKGPPHPEDNEITVLYHNMGKHGEYVLGP